MAAPPNETGHSRLIVWQKAMKLVRASYEVSWSLPTYERFALADQIRRAAVSIPANIAEGSGRRHRSDYARFLAVARGSSRELETLFGVVETCELGGGPALVRARGLLDEVSRMLTAMLRRLDPL